MNVSDGCEHVCRSVKNIGLPIALLFFYSVGKGLTEHLLGVMAEYGARGTFAVVGTTADKRPR